MWVHHIKTQPVIAWSKTAGEYQFTAHASLQPKDLTRLVTENSVRLRHSNILTQNIYELRRYLWANQNKFTTLCHAFFFFHFFYTLHVTLNGKEKNSRLHCCHTPNKELTCFMKSSKADPYIYMFETLYSLGCYSPTFFTKLIEFLFIYLSAKDHWCASLTS